YGMRRHEVHAEVAFGRQRAVEITSDLITNYVVRQQEAGAANATIKWGARRGQARLPLRQTTTETLRRSCTSRCYAKTMSGTAFSKQENFTRSSPACPTRYLLCSRLPISQGAGSVGPPQPAAVTRRFPEHLVPPRPRRAKESPERMLSLTPELRAYDPSNT